MMNQVLTKDKTLHDLKFDILEFGFNHGLFIHPDKDLDRFCEGTLSVGHCICKDNELYCPCNEALELCQKDGHCTCRLFITRERYLLELNKSREFRKKKDEQANNEALRRLAKRQFLLVKER